MSDMILPGTAGPAQVASGYTFCGGTNYNATGTASISQYASGTVTASATSSGFTIESSTGTTSTLTAYPFTVTGLTFQPRVIVVTTTAGSGTIASRVFYCADASFNTSMTNQASIFLSSGNTTTTGSSQNNNNVKLDGTVAYVNSTGFQLPAYSASSVCTWEAYV